MAKKGGTFKVGRSAKTGHFVKISYAKKTSKHYNCGDSEKKYRKAEIIEKL